MKMKGFMKNYKILTVLSTSVLIVGMTGCQQQDLEDPKPSKGKIVRVEGKMLLTEDSVGNQYNIFDDSTLDCDGHTIKASTADDRTTDHAIGLYGDNASVVNCVIDGYISGISVDSRISLTAQYKLAKLPKEEAFDYIDSLNERAKRHKTISSNTFKNIVKTPVFVQMFARDTIIKNNTFDSAGRMAIYLDAYSSEATITGNVISGSGYNHISGREGIAIDASSNNTISNNIFTENNIAAITLYKNCGERGIPRYFGANNNVIVNNNFEDERKGVWIASRADRSRFPDCIDKPIYGNIARDVAQHNTVQKNKYSDTAIAVDVRDDNNTITQNELNNAVISVGSQTRIAVGEPVTNNVIVGNE